MLPIVKTNVVYDKERDVLIDTSGPYYGSKKIT
jgi:hypothetical protein